MRLLTFIFIGFAVLALGYASSLERELENLERELLESEEGKQQQEYLRGYDDVRTAFTARLDHEEAYEPGDTLVFNDVLYNYNNGYDAKTNTFTAQSDGTYLFSFQIEHWDTYKLTGCLMVDYVIQVCALIAPRSTTSTQGGNTAVLGLKKGQCVWVQSKHSGKLFGGEGLTSFSGMFVY